MSPELPPHVLAFLNDHVSSLEHLEILALLRGQGPRRVIEILRALGSSEASILVRSSDLMASGLIRQEGNGSDATLILEADAAVIQMIDEVLTEYRDRRLAVIKAIYARIDQNIKVFSNAFNLRKKTP